jgi:FixJ family two-component response regulator
MKAGCDGYISKPINMDGFLDMIAGALGKNKRKKTTRKTHEII